MITNDKDHYDYYNNTIQHHSIGLKLVLGGTGIGKTSGIVKVIQEADTQGRKFVYIANRVQLLQEMAQRLNDENIRFAWVLGNLETVKQVIFDDNLWQELHELLNSRLISDLVHSHNHKNPSNQLDLSNLIKSLIYLHQLNPETLAYSDYQDDPNIRIATKIVHEFQSLMQAANAISEDTLNSLHQSTVIQTLFPYINFKNDEETTVLLITIQKAFMGFFDGSETLNITKLYGKNGKHIIFLDEYDFLEYELTQLICRATHIEEPFRFVEEFHREMKRHRLVREDYPLPATVPHNLRERIVDGITDLIDKLDIKYPAINLFTSQLEERKGVVFQTSRTLVHDRLYLKETERSFEIVKDEPEEDYIDALVFFKTIRKAMFRIIFLLMELRDNHPSIYAEIMRQAYRTSNFRNVIERINQLPRKHEIQQTRFDNLLEEGFGMYEIHELNQQTDPDEIEFRYYSIFITPEKLISKLAQSNLIFGLSATADMIRIVRNFSDEWFRKQAEEGLLNYIEVTSDDYAIIQSLNDKKKLARKNSIRVVQANELDEIDHKLIWDFVENSISRSLSGNEYKISRIRYFFTSLVWIVENYANNQLTHDSHLLFYNSFGEVKRLFAQPETSQSSWFVSKQILSEILPDTYELTFFEQKLIVVFYNAKNAKIFQHKDITNTFNELFWQKVPVLLVTQYPSAGNGVNIQYYPSPIATTKSDILNIHLLDAPYFYFNRRENTTQFNYNDWVAKVKENIWYLAKLYESGHISYGKFRAALEGIQYEDFNREYHKLAETRRDVVSNQMATFIQALGRIERVWNGVEDQTVILGKEVWSLFRQFCTNPKYSDLYEERLKTSSNNLRDIFNQIIQQTEIDDEYIELYKEEQLASRDALCRSRVAELLERLKDLRAGEKDEEAKEDWLKLRELALKQNFHHPLMKHHEGYATTFQAEYTHFRKGRMFINKHQEILPFDKPHGNDDVDMWHLDSVYYIIRQNPIVRAYFSHRGYELGFNNTTQKFFTPYFHLAVLAGAIGEEAIRAILMSKGLKLDDDIPDNLFELADLKLAERAWYIDCKNYSQQTLKYFEINENDPAWRPKLNDEDFKILARRKLEKIQSHHEGADCKLIYLNLASHKHWKGNYRMFDFSPANSFADAEIIIISGVIDRDNPTDLTKNFEIFIENLLHEIGL